MNISIIVAMDENRAIGKDNKLPWHLPRELQYVKQVTLGHSIVMGRKNFESIGRPLPGRRNIILTRNPSYEVEGCEVYQSVRDVLAACQNETETFIFGGEEIYKLFLPYVNKLYITKIHHSFEGDTFFPEVDLSGWKETFNEQGVRDESNPYEYHFHVYEKQS